MSTLENMLICYKTEKGIFTNRALANSLGVSETALQNYRSGIRKMPDIAIVKIADTLDIDATEVLAAVNVNLKATTDNEMNFWMGKLIDLGSKFAGVTMLLVILNLTPTPSQAAPVLDSQVGKDLHYVK